MTERVESEEKPVKKQKENLESTTEDSAVRVTLREIVLSSMLFVILFGGLTTAAGFFGGLYAAQSFFIQFDERDPTMSAVVEKYCTEMSMAYKLTIANQTEKIDQQKYVLDYYNEFIADKNITAIVANGPRRSVGGEGKKKKKGK